MSTMDGGGRTVDGKRTMKLSEEQIRWFRLRRNGLVDPFASPEAAVGALAGVQAQILTASMLALWNRSAAGADGEAAVAARLFEGRTLLRLWGQRHTLHLYAREDWPTLYAAFSGRRTWWERQTARDPTLDLAAYREGVARVATLMRERGTLSRKELRASGIPLPDALLSPWGGVFAELVRLGEACHARWDGGEARYAHRGHWLPDFAWSPPTMEAANIELTRRFFRCYGPASAGDFFYWRGVAAGAAWGWLRALEGELVEVDGERRLLAWKEDLPDLFAEPPEREAWPVRMLGRFDPMLLAHRVKDWIVAPAYYSRVWRPAGHIEAVVLEHGQAVGTWRYDRIGAGKLSVRVFPFRGRWPGHVGKAVRQQAKAVAGFFGLGLAGVSVEKGL